MENKVISTEYVKKNFIEKYKVLNIIDNHLKNTELNPTGYCLSFIGCQKVVKEIFKLLEEECEI